MPLHVPQYIVRACVRVCVVVFALIKKYGDLRMCLANDRVRLKQGS